MRAIHADGVILGDTPAIRDGAVVVADDGEVLAAGVAGDMLAAWPNADEVRIRGVVFPGLVNAHTHVELSWMRGKVNGGDGFPRWLDRLVATRAESTAEEAAEGIDRAVAELLASGTVALGEVSNTLAPVPALARAGFAGSVFHEVFGMDRADVLRRVGALREELEERVSTWPSTDLAYAPSPHTLYTLHLDAARALFDYALENDLRVSIHLAEHAAERRAVERGEGPMRDFFERWLKQRPVWPERPLFDVAEEAGALRPNVLLVHLTDAQPKELARVAASGAAVVLCPRSNLFIEGRLPPLLAVREAGIEAALGTDSLASNTSLDVLAEARALADRFPNVPAWELLRMATWNGALALGRPDLGRIAKGSRPGIFAVEGDLAGKDPAAFLLANVRAPRRRLVRRDKPS